MIRISEVLQGASLSPSPTPTAGVLHDETSASSAAVPPSPGPNVHDQATFAGDVDEFTLDDVAFAKRQAAEFNANGGAESERTWLELASKIEKVLVGEYVKFTHTDAQLIQSLHLVILRDPLENGNKAKSRALSRLGKLVALAERGALEQLRRWRR